MREFRTGYFAAPRNADRRSEPGNVATRIDIAVRQVSTRTGMLYCTHYQMERNEMGNCSFIGCVHAGKLIKGLCKKHYKRLWRNGTLSPTKQVQDSLLERFNRQTNKLSDNDNCWEWVGTKIKGGYGRISKNGRPAMAHRVSWELANGHIPSGMQVLHRCDNPSCVRPDHLFLGDRFINMQDKIKKGRGRTGSAQKGEKSGRSKLTDSDVLAIRQDIRTRKTIAAGYGIHPMTVSNIKNRRTWTHI